MTGFYLSMAHAKAQYKHARMEREMEKELMASMTPEQFSAWMTAQREERQRKELLETIRIAGINAGRGRFDGIRW